MSPAESAIRWLRDRAQHHLADHVERAQPTNINPTARELSRQVIRRLQLSHWRTRHNRDAVEVAAGGAGMAERPRVLA